MASIFNVPPEGDGWVVLVVSVVNLLMDVADVNKYKIISNIFWFFSIFKLCDTFLQIISIEIWNVKLARGN